MAVILGINAFHPDSSACLIINGKIMSAISEERLGSRQKHTNVFPNNAINFVLEDNNLTLADVDHIAFSYDSRKNILQKMLFVIFNPFLSISMVQNYLGKFSRSKQFKSKFSKQFKELSNLTAKIHYVEHHKAHIASAYYVSNLEGPTLGLSLDGSGDFVSCMVAMFDSQISLIKKNYVPHSLGHFYSAMCQFIGFDRFGEEYKVMGLAPYGSDKYGEMLNKLITVKNGKIKLNKKYFSIGKAFAAMSKNKEGDLSLGRLYTHQLIKLVGKPRLRDQPIKQFHKDIARSTQVIFESCMFSLIKYYSQQTDAINLVMAGGCSLNGVFNAKLKKEKLFENIFIQPASSDDGLSLGAALQVCNDINELKKNKSVFSPYLGQSFDDAFIEDQIQLTKNSYVKFVSKDSLISDAAKEIADGSVVGWFQGKSEWGPRALGNRSILANPSIKNMKDEINYKIKKRESFRPFAPSVLEEDVNELFEYFVKSPYMMDVVPFKEKYYSKLPSVVHVDGTGRLQTVSPRLNKLYYDLIKAVKQHTGYGVVLNTSFNENEPIVNAPIEALNCFNRTELDTLYIGQFKVHR